MNRTADVATRPVYRILSLAGGGAKGFYTLGVLEELECMVGERLSQHFHLIYGTSTGSIIAALLAQGHSVREIHDLYRDNVPSLMQNRSARTRTQALAALAARVFGSAGFDQLETDVGIVATRWELETPMIFKSSRAHAHGRAASFVAGFGVPLADAVRASCSAYPFFERATLTTSRGAEVELIDGGYCANNPTLYAIADAVGSGKVARSELRVVSVGVGTYPEPKRGMLLRWAQRFWVVELLQKTLEINTQSMEKLRGVLFPDVPTVRISDTFQKPELATDLLESDPKKLNLLRQCGRESFGAREPEFRALLARKE